jgi:hypothetical protein
MAKDVSASIISLHQPRKALTAAERARAYRQRKKAEPETVTIESVTPSRVTKPITVASRVTNTVTASRFNLAPVILATASIGLAGVGVVVNGTFAHSLGSSNLAGWLFLAIGVAADAVALAVPSCAAGLWQAHRRGAALAGWSIWLVTFAFAVTAGLGFASINITDVTQARASRVTPAIEIAKASLSDAMASRDRECSGGVGKNCRAREDAVTEQRRALETAMRSVEQNADPQTEALIRVVAWLTCGLVRPSGDDFAMLRLVLLALFPQLGGVLLMVARAKK